MKKLVYLFAIMLGISFASCTGCNNENNNASDQEQVTDTLANNEAGTDSIVNDTTQAGDDQEAAPAQETKAEEAK